MCIFTVKLPLGTTILNNIFLSHAMVGRIVFKLGAFVFKKIGQLLHVTVIQDGSTLEV